MKAFILKPQTSFRTELRSDTLWGLIIVAIKYLYGDAKVTEIIRSYLENKPEFLVSSTMLCKIDWKVNESGEQVPIVKEFYFPKPILKPFSTLDFDKDELKLYKKEKIVNKATFEEFINGEKSDSDYFSTKEWKEKNGNSDKEQKKKEEDKKPKIKEEALVKNTIDRLTNTTKETSERGLLYTSIEKFIAPSEALYFLADGNTDLIEEALRLLTHFGYGGDNSTGKGYFHYYAQDFEIRLPSEGKHFITLSLYSPTQDEIEQIKASQDRVWYELIKRSGKIANQFRIDGEYNKGPLFFFGEGSTFPAFKSHYGKLIEIKKLNDFSIYHYGFSFNLLANFKE